MRTEHAVYADLIAEGDALDRLVAGLDSASWSMQTPAPGWTIAHQVAHLASVARLAESAAANPDLFKKQAAHAAGDFDAAVKALLEPYLVHAPAGLFAKWRADRNAAAEALAALPPDRLIPWLVRPLPAGVLAAAGMMELFAHGQDIADAVGASRQITDRIRHVAGFAVRTRDFGYIVRGEMPPAAPFRFELIAPVRPAVGLRP